MINGRLQTYYGDFLILIYSTFVNQLFCYIVWDGVIIELRMQYSATSDNSVIYL